MGFVLLAVSANPWVCMAGLAFAVYALVATPVEYKTAVQAVIFILLGSGGLAMNNRRR